MQMIDMTPDQRHVRNELDALITEMASAANHAQRTVFHAPVRCARHLENYREVAAEFEDRMTAVLAQVQRQATGDITPTEPGDLAVVGSAPC